MNTALSADERAERALKEMTLEEKLQLAHGMGWGVLKPNMPIAAGAGTSAGFVQGIERLGIPAIKMQDSAVGVRLSALEGRYSTLLPSTLGAAASWDPAAAELYGQVIGRELRAQGYNMSIGGGVNLMREPRNGRNFEYAGEDPLLAGTMVGTVEKGVADEHIMNDIKHYALNDQETGREVVNVVMDEQALRESDMLAFEIALGIAKPSGVMCSYNRFRGDYACENDHLLNGILKGEFGFQGFVLSDWGATHSTVKAALAGLDMEQAGDYYGKSFFGTPLAEAVKSGQVPAARIDDLAQRVLRSLFASGVVDDPPVKTVVDPFRGRTDAQSIEEESIVLLRNRDVLPLRADVASIAVIGGHADAGVLSGGGSAQVDPPGGDAVTHQQGTGKWMGVVYFPSVPLKALAEQAPGAKVDFNDGVDVSSAAELARRSSVAIVFVTQPMHEDVDAATLALPGHQDALVAAVAAANPRTVVVVESGGPVTMPWATDVAGIVEAWYPGIGGAEALANVLFGKVNPSGKLPATFPRTESDLPHAVIAGLSERATGKSNNRLTPFDVHYTEGERAGYKWFDSEGKQPLYPFGFGLSYTTYTYSALALDAAKRTATVMVRNTGARDGTEIVEVYAQLPGDRYKRLAGWQRVALKAGEAKTVTIALDARVLENYDAAAQRWIAPAGEVRVFAGASSRELPLKATLHR